MTLPNRIYEWRKREGCTKTHIVLQGISTALCEIDTGGSFRVNNLDPQRQGLCTVCLKFAVFRGILVLKENRG